MNKLEPLEIKRAILSEIDEGIISIGDNRRIFPYTAIEISLNTRDEVSKGIFSVAFINDNSLERVIHNHLKPPRCEQSEPRIKIVLIDLTDEPQSSKKFEINFISETTKSKEIEAYLEVFEGLANRKQLRLHHSETFIGRCEQAVAKGSKVIRVNDLYFLDSREYVGRMSEDLKTNEQINQSVSRKHARIIYNEQDGRHYVYDDGSSKGTTLLRGGRGVAENVDRHVGKALGNGDILCFGKARVKFKLIRKGEPPPKTKTADQSKAE